MMLLRKFIKSINPHAISIQKRASGDICSAGDFRRILELERERADRNRHRFALVVFDIKAIDVNNEAIKGMIHSIIRRVRKIDHIGWYHDGHIAILLPYTSIQGAHKLIEDISSSLNFQMSESAYDVYLYPFQEMEAEKVKTKTV